MAYLQEFRNMPQTPDAVFQRGCWDRAPGMLLDEVDDTLNSWKEAHEVFNTHQGNEQKVQLNAFTGMRTLVHKVIRGEIMNTEHSYTNEAITYALLLRWIDQRQRGLAMGEQF